MPEVKIFSRANSESDAEFERQLKALRRGTSRLEGDSTVVYKSVELSPDEISEFTERYAELALSSIERVRQRRLDKAVRAQIVGTPTTSVGDEADPPESMGNTPS